jgi:hypothetical protein
VSTVKPSHKKTERLILLIRKTKLAILVFLAVEDVAEELAAVAQELLVQDPFGVFLTDVDVDHVMRQKPIATSVSVLASMRLSLG